MNNAPTLPPPPFHRATGFRWMLALVLGLLLVAAYAGWEAFRAYEAADSALAMVEAHKAEIRRYQDAAGRQVAEIQVQQATISQLEAMRRSDDARYADLAKQVGGLKNLVQSTDFKTRTEREIRIVPGDTIIDSVRALKLHYADQWTRISGLVTPDSAILRPVYFDSYRVNTYWRKRPGLFQGRELVTQIVPQNPYTRVDTLNTVYVVKPAKKPFYRTQGAAALTGALTTLFLILL